jgi:hypothetical protein
MKMKRNAFLVTVLALSLAGMSAAVLVVPTFTGSTAAVSAVTSTKISEYEVMYSANTFAPARASRQFRANLHPVTHLYR